MFNCKGYRFFGPKVQRLHSTDGGFRCSVVYTDLTVRMLSFFDVDFFPTQNGMKLLWLLESLFVDLSKEKRGTADFVVLWSSQIEKGTTWTRRLVKSRNSLWFIRVRRARLDCTTGSDGFIAYMCKQW